MFHACVRTLLTIFVAAQEGIGVNLGDSVAKGYTCDPQSCKLPACLCPSLNPPGGKKPPLFITLTFDDSVNSIVMPIILNDTCIYIYINGEFSKLY